MARTRVTLRDVARRVGVHPSTVSRVLSPATRTMVSDEVALRVMKTAEEMGYRANPFAYSLRTNRSFTVGVLIPDLTNPVFPPIIRGIEKTLGEAGYTAMLGNSGEDPEQERILLDTMKARQVDGLILATAHRADALIKECLSEGIPLVLLNRAIEDKGAVSVINDDIAGIGLAVDHVVALGHRHIAHLGGPQDYSTGYMRYQGFLKGMRANGLEPDPELIRFGKAFSEEEGRRVTLELLDAGPGITAIVTANDLMALGCYDALEERGIVCPERISVTGYNDMPFIDKFKPPLTSVRISHYQMGAEAAGLLLRLMQNGKEPVASVTLAPELVVRGSTAPPPAGD